MRNRIIFGVISLVVLSFAIVFSCGKDDDDETTTAAATAKDVNCTITDGTATFCMEKDDGSTSDSSTIQSACTTWNIKAAYTGTFSENALCATDNKVDHGTCATSEGYPVYFYSPAYSSSNIEASCTGIGATYTAP